MNSSLSSPNRQYLLIHNETFSSAIAKNAVVIFLGITINCINGFLIQTFRKHQVFYTNPRYILFIHLVVNDIIQLLTSILLFTLSYFLQINFIFCCIIISFVVMSTVNSPLNLSVMAVECYIAVCFPLRHPGLCAVKKIYIIIACIWAMSALSIIPEIVFVLSTISDHQLFVSTLLCSINQLLPNAVLIKKRNVLYIVYLVCVWLTLVYTYFQIFIAAKSNGSVKYSDTKKARDTILLHAFQLLLCMLTYVYPLGLQSIIKMFPQYFMHVVFLWYILVQILPRAVSSVVYGLRDSLFRKHLKEYLHRLSCVRS